MNILKALEKKYETHRDSAVAQAQKQYMRGLFSYYGIKAPKRNELQRAFLIKSNLPVKREATELIKRLWEKEERDYQYFAMELMFKYTSQFEKNDMELFEFMAIQKSWWDTIDYIAPKLMGAYFKKYPELRRKYCQKWLKSGNIWLQRCALLFQLKYKQDLDTDLLSHNITFLSGSREFFINKAIGWVLREYSKTNAQWVKEFIETNELAPLSRREASKYL